jgi:hypothetical protein
VVKRTNSLYNSPLFCVLKKQGQGLGIVQDFRELDNHSHIDKYSMKEITECIGDIGRANSTIFSTLDLTSGFWQMKMDEDLQPLTTFTIPGKGQFSSQFSGQFSKIDGGCFEKYQKCSGLHR